MTTVVNRAMPMQALLDDKSVAALLGMSVGSIRRWRLVGGQGPKWLKLGGAVRYRIEDVNAWLDSCSKEAK